MPVLGYPGSLKAVFGASNQRVPTMLDEYVDEAVPEYIQSSLLGSSAALGRRSRLDDSAGEGLRRNVLVRNAMLSSLERERRQVTEDAAPCSTDTSTSATEQCSSAVIMDEEAQFFEDLLSELSGSDRSDPANPVLTPAVSSKSTAASASLEPVRGDDEEDFVELEVGPMDEFLVSDGVESDVSITSSALHFDDRPPATAALAKAEQPRPFGSTLPPALLDSCSSALTAPPGCTDSGFAEETSRPASAAGCCTGYPNVCPYPAVSSYVEGSSEELPALIDDDSDADDDEDEVDDQSHDAQEAAQVADAVQFGSDAPALLNPDGDQTLSHPLSPVASPVHSICVEHTGFHDSLSPEPSRPTSPISSASSKGDGDSTSPSLLPSDLGAFPSLAELSLQLPAASGADLLSRPSRALAGAWFEHKHDASSGQSSSADRIRWTTSQTSYFRPGTSASPSTASDYRPPGSDVEPYRSTSPSLATNNVSDPAIVVHWSR